MSAEYMHIGIPITNKKPGMTYNEGAKFWVSNVDDYDYKIDANRALEAFTGRWVPVPFLRLSNEQWKDGAFTVINYNLDAAYLNGGEDDDE